MECNDTVLLCSLYVGFYLLNQCNCEELCGLLSLWNIAHEGMIMQFAVAQAMA